MTPLAGCSGTPTAVPTIGSPQPVAAATPATPTGRAAELARRWHLTGTALPDDWPDVPLPERTEVVTAYAIGAQPRRTWTATFASDTGTALHLAQPVVAAMRARGYVPIAQYVGEASTNTGLYSFAAPTFAVYLVLGEDDGRPNLVITIRGTTDPNAGLPTPEPSISGGAILPSAAATATPGAQSDTTASASPSASPTP